MSSVIVMLVGQDPTVIKKRCHVNATRLTTSVVIYDRTIHLLVPAHMAHHPPSHPHPHQCVPLGIE